MEIYKKLHEIQKKVSGLKKDTKAFGYDYVSGTKLLSFIKPLMDSGGLILKQEILSIDNDRQDYISKKGDEKNEILTKVMMKFTWIDIETGEKDENSFGANGQNGWDKGVGSALTYAERYFLLKYFHIATDEDDIDQPEPKTSLSAEQFKRLLSSDKQVMQKAFEDHSLTNEQTLKLTTKIESINA